MLDLVRDHPADPAPGATAAARTARHLHRGNPKAAAADLPPGDDPVTSALRLLVTYHDLAWFPGGFGADAPQDVLAAVYRDLPGTGVAPGLGAAVDLARRAGAWRFLVIGSSRVDASVGAQAAERMVGDLHRMFDRVDSSDDARLRGHALLVAADILRLGGRPELGDRYCQEAHNLFAVAGDEVGVGCCNLLVADAALTPWTSPECQGLDLWDLSRSPHEVGAEGAAAAGTACEGALAAFGRAGSPRGRAATMLRQGYAALETGDATAAARAASTAAELAAAAGDEACHALARTHQLVALVAQGRPGELRLRLPADVVRWARTVGSESFGRGLGRVLRGVGLRRLRAGQAEQARLLLSAALEIATGIGQAAERVACIEDAAALYGTLNSRGPAIGNLHAALDAHLQQDPLPIEGWMQAAAVLAALNGQYSAERDPQGQEWCRDRAVELVARGPRPPGETAGDLFAAARSRYEALSEQGRRRVTADGAANPGTFVDEMTASIAASLADTIAHASVLAPLSRGLQQRRDGLDALAAASLREALHAATGLGERGASLCVLALAADRRYAEAAAAVRELPAGFPDDLRVDLLVAARQYGPAAALLPDSPPVDGSVPERWRAGITAAEIALRTGDLGRARALTVAGCVAFEEWFAGLERDPFRVGVTDDVNARWLYLLAGEAALLDGDTAASLVLGDRLRALPLLRLGRDRRSDEPVHLAWKEATARWSAAYDVLAWHGTATVHRRTDDPALDLADPDAGPAALLDSAQLELERAESRLDRGHAELPTMPDVAALRRHLPEGALLVQYLLAGDRLLTWVLGADLLEGTTRAVDADRISGQVRRVHAASAGRYLPGDSEQSRRELGRLLLEPVAGHLTRHHRVVVVPSGTLNLLPFPVLPLGGDVLGATHVVSILPAAAVLTRTFPARAAVGEAIVVGDPAFASDTRLPHLPGTRVEALAVARHHGVTALIGADASAAGLRERLPAARLVHLATHGLVSEIAPTASALALQGTDRLTVADLAGLRLDADLVLLSACDTGRGDITIGGDVVGLARQLLAAGARAVVVSLWPVDDESTCVLMDELHRRLVNGEGAAVALAGAQALLRSLSVDERHARYGQLAGSVGEDPARGQRRRARRAPGGGVGVLRHAREWAAFVLIGDPGAGLRAASRAVGP